MSKYRCLNQNCNNLWETDEDPFTCPSCGESNFKKEASSNSWVKWSVIAIVSILALIILIRACSSNGKTTVKTDVNTKICQLKVSIEGNHKSEYSIVLRKDGVVHGRKDNKSNAIFNQLNGTYTLDIIFRGKGGIPQINGYKKVFSFTAPPSTPQITTITPSPSKLTSPKKRYSITIATDETIVPLAETEFSSDGTTWQNSEVFNFIAAGTHTFYVRNSKQHDLIDSRQIILEPFIPTPPPTVAQLNELLKKIASCDDDASDKMKRILGATLTVEGVTYINTIQQLVTDACTMNKLYEVKRINLNESGIVVSIEIK